MPRGFNLLRFPEVGKAGRCLGTAPAGVPEQRSGRGCAPHELSLTRTDRAPPLGSPQPAFHVAVPTVPTSPEGQPGRRSSPGEAQLGWRLEELTHLVLGGRSVSARRRFSEETGPQAGQGHGCRPPRGPGSLQQLVLTLVPPPSGRDPQSRSRIPREDPPLASLHIFLCSLPLRSCPARSDKRDFPRLPCGGARPWQRLRRPRGMAAAAGRSRLTWCTLHSPGGLRA